MKVKEIRTGSYAQVRVVVAYLGGRKMHILKNIEVVEMPQQKYLLGRRGNKRYSYGEGAEVLGSLDVLLQTTAKKEDL